jgi:hypothetical protein
MIFINHRPLSNQNFRNQLQNHSQLYLVSRNSYAQIVHIQKKRKELIEKKLKENLPVTYFFVHFIVLSIVSIALVVLQVFAIMHKAPFFYVASGIW